MRRVFVSLVAAMTLVVVLAPASSAATRGAECTPAEKCCKICEAGQACGNACIGARKQCHKGRGCACNASEVCPAGG